MGIDFNSEELRSKFRFSEISLLREIFYSFDRLHTGKIDFTSFKKAFLTIGVSMKESDIAEYLKESEEITFEEFLEVVSKVKQKYKVHIHQ